MKTADKDAQRCIRQIGCGVIGFFILVLILSVPQSLYAQGLGEKALGKAVFDLVHTGGQGCVHKAVEDVVRDVPGCEVVGAGSHVSGRYRPGLSDHDFTMKILDEKNPAVLKNRWLRGRTIFREGIEGHAAQELEQRIYNELSKTIQDPQKIDEIIREMRPKINMQAKSLAEDFVSRTNLYPPSQLMEGVTNETEAAARFRELGAPPAIKYPNGAQLSEKEWRAAAEGLYGEGQKSFIQWYEKTAGRAWYKDSKTGKVRTGSADLGHLGEGYGKYTLEGVSSNARQWSQKAIHAIEHGDYPSAFKYIERLENDLKKGTDLARFQNVRATGLNKFVEKFKIIKSVNSHLSPEAYSRAVDKAVMKMMENPALREEFTLALREARFQAELLHSLSGTANPWAKMLIRDTMGGTTRAAEEFRGTLKDVMKKVPVSKILTALFAYLDIKDAAAKAGRGEDDEAARKVVEGALFAIGSMGPAAAAVVTNIFLDWVKERGFTYSVLTQDCEDLLAGIIEVRGWESATGYGKASETNIDELARNITEEKKVRAIVERAVRDAAGEGSDSKKIRSGKQKPLMSRCADEIVTKWRNRRMEMLGEYLTAMDALRAALQGSAGLIEVEPDPALLLKRRGKPGKSAFVTVTANLMDRQWEKIRARAAALRKKARRLGGRRHKVSVGFYRFVQWYVDGRPFGKEEKQLHWDALISQIKLPFDTPGKYKISCDVKWNIRLQSAITESGTVTHEQLEIFKAIFSLKLPGYYTTTKRGNALVDYHKYTSATDKMSLHGLVTVKDSDLTDVLRVVIKGPSKLLLGDKAALEASVESAAEIHAEKLKFSWSRNVKPIGSTAIFQAKTPGIHTVKVKVSKGAEKLAESYPFHIEVVDPQKSLFSLKITGPDHAGLKGDVILHGVIRAENDPARLLLGRGKALWIEWLVGGKVLETGDAMRMGFPSKGLYTVTARLVREIGGKRKVVATSSHKINVGNFQALLAEEARIAHSPLRLGKPAVFALKITGKKLKEMWDKGRLTVTWRSPHGKFVSGGKGVKVHFVTYRLLPVTVEAIVRDRSDATEKGILTVVVPVAVPKGLFRLTLKPSRPKPKEFVRADVGMPDRYLNSYQFHYTWRGKNCRVEGKDQSHVVVTAPKAGKATVTVTVSATDKHGKRIALGSDAVSFNVSSVKGKPKNKKKKKKTAKKGAGGEAPSGSTAGAKTGGSGGGTETGAEPGAGTIKVGKKPAKQPKKVVKHGAGGSASGMYPAETFNGMQISYSVSGASMPKMKDVHDFTTSRHYEGRLGSGTLSVSGTARVTSSPYIVLSVSVSAGSKHAERTYKFKGPGSRSFSLKVPIPQDATTGGFSISMSGSYGNGEVRGLVVSGDFTENGPEGKAPKGTEDLSVTLTGPKNPVQAGKKVEITAAVRGGRFPYKYVWSGAKGTGEKGVFQSAASGAHTVSLKVTDADGNTVSGSVKVVVESPEFEVTGLPARPIYGSTARLRVRVKKGGKGPYTPIWQASEPGIEFDPPEGMETTVTFGRVKKIAVWVQVPQPAGQKTIESKQVHAQVVGPKFTLSLNPTNPYVGQEVRARISSSARIPDDAIRWVWTSPPSSNRMEYNDPASEIGFKLKGDKPLTLQAEARVPHYGDVIGTVRKSIQAKRYDVKVTVLGLMGPKPRVWKEGKGLVEVKKAIAVHQNVRLLAKITPTPKVSPIYYHWTLNEDSHFAGLSMGKEVTVNRSQTGSCIATVIVKDKDGTILGKGTGTFSVTISQARINAGKKKAKDQKEAAKLLQQARSQWSKGRLAEAIATLKKARALDPLNRDIPRELKDKGRKKARIDRDLKQADSRIARGKLKEAKRLLDRQPGFAKGYEPYKEAAKRLEAALAKEKEKKERLARAEKMRKTAHVFWKHKRYEKAISVMSEALTLDPRNAEAQKTLAEWKKKVKIYAQADKLEKDGALLEAAGELKEAVTTYKKSLALRPDKDLAAHVKDLETKIAAQEKKEKEKEKTKVAQAGGQQPKKGTKKPLSEDDIFGGDKGKKAGTPKGGLKIEDVLPGGGEKKPSPKKVASGPGKKPLGLDDIFGKGEGQKKTSPPVKSGGKKAPSRKDLEKKRDRLIREGYAAEKAGRLEEAILKYSEAQKIRRDAKVAAHIAELKRKIRAFDRLIQKGYHYEKKGRLAKAIAAYKKALRIRYDKKVAAHIHSLEKKIAWGFPADVVKKPPSTASTLKHGVWVLTRVQGEVGIPVNKKSSYWRDLISGREGRIVMVNTIRKSGYVAFKSVSTWQRPPNRLVPGSKVAFTLTIHKLADPRKYSENHGLSMDTQDLGCGGSYGGGKIGSVGVYSVHSPKNPTVRKTFPWKVPEGRKGKTLTIRVCYSGVSFKGDRGWRYYYTWVPAGEPIPKGIKGGAGGVTETMPHRKAKAKVTTATSSTYAPNTKGDVFKGGHWAGSQGKSDWIQKNFNRVIPISKIYIGEASTDITTQGFRLILKLRRPDGRWVVVDELRNTNINRSRLSGGRKGHSIPPYTKKISPPIPATAFRLEFYGHGWFDATDIRFYTPRKKSAKVKRLPWTGTYRFDVRDQEGSMFVVLKLKQTGNKLQGVIRAKAVSPRGKGLNFDFRKTLTGVCSGNRGKIKIKGQPYDKVVLFENGQKLAIYDAEDHKKYILHRVQ